MSCQKPPVREASGTAASPTPPPTASHAGVSAPCAAVRGPLKDDMAVEHQPGHTACAEGRGVVVSDVKVRL